jgi:hypothetical protein
MIIVITVWWMKCLMMSWLSLNNMINLKDRRIEYYGSSQIGAELIDYTNAIQNWIVVNMNKDFTSFSMIG